MKTYYKEIIRIKQTLANNDYPQNFVDKWISKTYNNLIKKRIDQDEKTPDTLLYFKNQMSHDYKLEEYKLKDIVKRH